MCETGIRSISEDPDCRVGAEHGNGPEKGEESVVFFTND